LKNRTTLLETPGRDMPMVYNLNNFGWRNGFAKTWVLMRLDL
jgi:hypothetical protein